VSAHAAAPDTPNRADELRRHVAERNVAAILDATLLQLERDPKPSLAAIAKAAGVSRPTLYAHFPTREDLVEAAVKRALDETQREIATAGIDDGPASDALQRLITTGWRVLARHLAIARLALDVLPPERLRGAHQAALDPLRRLIARGQRAGEFRDDQPVEWMVTILYALLHAAAGDVSSGRLDGQSAAKLISDSALGAYMPHPPHAHHHERGLNRRCLTPPTSSAMGRSRPSS
jgi:TetR/AcrR family transcriptional repressor of mexCD-oprJ operon